MRKKYFWLRADPSLKVCLERLRNDLERQHRRRFSLNEASFYLAELLEGRRR